MRKINVVGFATALVLGALLAGCGETETKATPTPTANPQTSYGEVAGEKLLWASSSSRPGWVSVTPDGDDKALYFVGISSDYATEQLARDDSYRKAITRVTQYMGTLAKDKFEKTSVSMGLASSVVDPTEATRQYEKQLATNIAKQVKEKEHYTERWQKPTGNAWKDFVLVAFPVGASNDTFKKAADDNLKKAQEDAKSAATDQAKKQAQDAIDFWSKMKEQNLVD